MCGLMNEWKACGARNKKVRDGGKRRTRKTELSYRLGESTSVVRMREIRSQSAVLQSTGLVETIQRRVTSLHNEIISLTGETRQRLLFDDNMKFELYFSLLIKKSHAILELHNAHARLIDEIMSYLYRMFIVVSTISQKM